MVKSRESRLEKGAEETRTENKRGAEEKPAWYRNWWGGLSAISLVLLFFLVNRISVSNCYVALLAAGFAFLFLRVRSRVVKLISGLFWLLFIPNTAYLFTDLGHIVYQWNNAGSAAGRMLLLAQYLLLELFGIITFLFSFLPFEKIIERVNFFKKRKVTWVILFNFYVAFGLVLGRFEHINSWVLFTNPLKVLGSAINILVSFDLLGLAILIGLLCNCVYFLFRGWLLQRAMKEFETVKA